MGATGYFGASGGHLRREQLGDPDLGWVGRYKDRTAPHRPSSWRRVPGADFDYVRITKP